MERTTHVIGQSGAFLDALELASRAAALDRPVLVIGERGTGKELVAERLHRHVPAPLGAQKLASLVDLAIPELGYSDHTDYASNHLAGAYDKRHGVEWKQSRRASNAAGGAMPTVLTPAALDDAIGDEAEPGQEEEMLLREMADAVAPAP